MSSTVLIINQQVNKYWFLSGSTVLIINQQVNKSWFLLGSTALIINQQINKSWLLFGSTALIINQQVNKSWFLSECMDQNEGVGPCRAWLNVVDDCVKKRNINSFKNKRAFMIRCVDVVETKGVCKDREVRRKLIQSYLRKLEKKYRKLVRVESIGKTYEGRDILVIQISTDRSARRPIVLIDAGIHAREWIAPSMALYIINRLVENQDDTEELAAKVDWHIIPVINPDGYEYTHTKIFNVHFKK
uniref:(California timema) hypothetical protein n=1 Tax=Timema californicum TaxID=61474 RepID=A0A7R9IZ88_TIMCA|nr:unnamed protein product [Timema californicum]